MAADLLAELREKRGLTPESMPREMVRAGVQRDRIPTPSTIRRIECHGVVPHVPYMAGLAQFFERDMHAIWAPPARRKVAA